MTKRFSTDELFAIRNHVPILYVIERVLKVPSAGDGTARRFACPVCLAYEIGLNPETNLTRCFRCRRNFNTIELVMSVRGTGFVETVRLLQRCAQKLAIHHDDYLPQKIPASRSTEQRATSCPQSVRDILKG